jgi:hypothetical protein
VGFPNLLSLKICERFRQIHGNLNLRPYVDKVIAWKSAAGNRNCSSTKCIQILRRKTKRKKQFRRPRHRWANSIKIYLKSGLEGLNWIYLA